MPPRPCRCRGEGMAGSAVRSASRPCRSPGVGGVTPMIRAIWPLGDGRTRGLSAFMIADDSLRFPPGVIVRDHGTAAPGRAGPARHDHGGLGRLLLPEAAEETAEQPALPRQGRRRRWRHRSLGGYRLVVVGPRDGIDDLRLAEVLGPVDLGHEADQVAVLHDLCLEPGGSVGAPLRLATVVQRPPYPELIPAAPHPGAAVPAPPRATPAPPGPCTFP